MTTTILPPETELIEPELMPEPKPVEQPKRRSAREDHARLNAWFNPARLTRSNLDWVVIGFMIFVHAGALAAPFYFSWTGLAVCVVLHWMTCSLGICLGYHRYLSHRSMRLKTPSEMFVMLCGVLSGEGPPLTWSAVHRMHHQKSDHEGDPHSPNQGSFWSHFLWLFPKWHVDQADVLFDRYIPELRKRPVLRMFEKTYGLWLIGTGVVMLAIGGLIGGWYMALSMLFWGMCMRMVFAYHSTWFVNSATHIWGYRNYTTRDRSKNLWWVAIMAYGEGWHNNHHAHPSVAPAGHKWWEFDITWWSIKFLRAIGQAYDVNDNIPQGTAAGADELH